MLEQTVRAENTAVANIARVTKNHERKKEKSRKGATNPGVENRPFKGTLPPTEARKNGTAH